MTKTKQILNIDELFIGAIIRKSGESDSLCVVNMTDSIVVGVRHIHITNPSEWLLSEDDVCLLEDLDRGDVVVSKLSTAEYVIQANYGKYCFGVRSEVISNFDDWQMILPPSGLDDFSVMAKNYGFSSETIARLHKPDINK